MLANGSECHVTKTGLWNNGTILRFYDFTILRFLAWVVEEFVGMIWDVVDGWTKRDGKPWTESVEGMEATWKPTWKPTWKRPKLPLGKIEQFNNSQSPTGYTDAPITCSKPIR